MSITNGNGAHPKKVWATLITNTPYLPGLLVLEHSLREVGSVYPLVALYTDAFPPEGHAALDRRAIPKRRIEKLLPKVEKSYGDDPRFANTWSKLAVFECTEFDRVVLLDSDMLVKRNMDELMDIPLDLPCHAAEGEGQRVFAAAHACVCNPLRKPHYPPNWIPSNCAFHSQHHDADAAQREAAPNTLSFGMPNSGLVVVNPSTDILELIREKLKDESVGKYIFPDQELLGDVFKGRWVTLPYVYNALKPMRKEGVHSSIWRDSEVRNLHYILSPKPWDERPENADEVNTWWHESNKRRLIMEEREGVRDELEHNEHLN